LPVVSTTINGIPELVLDRRTGLLVVSGRADRLADALQELHADADLGRRLGENGRDAVLQDHEPEVSARALLELFRRYERPAGEPSSRTGRRGPGPT
ncbi:MAG: glycosyltransferase, partial [Blastococcus sp.]|nr:glycosyltransferase [Blastococcus sp.]